MLNAKNGTGVVNQVFLPDTISGWSDGNDTKLDSIKIQNNFIYITSSTFKDSGDYKIARNLPKQTKKFKLQGNQLVEVR